MALRRPDGGIGRRASFRCWYPKGCGGSSPLLGTIPFSSIDFARFLPIFLPRSPTRFGVGRSRWQFVPISNDLSIWLCGSRAIHRSSLALSVKFIDQRHCPFQADCSSFDDGGARPVDPEVHCGVASRRCNYRMMIISAVDRDAVPAVFLDVYRHPPFLSLRLALMTSLLADFAALAVVWYWSPFGMLRPAHPHALRCARHGTGDPFLTVSRARILPACRARSKDPRRGPPRGSHPKAKVGTGHLGFPSLLSLDQAAISRLFISATSACSAVEYQPRIPGQNGSETCQCRHP